ncbi:MAG: ABC transporter permease subunit [Clostridiales bacterium]|jgi:putative aldouronate transport system permease protein|nr:ABC transporter permease subunit [Clostridiales bacterium]
MIKAMRSDSAKPAKKQSLRSDLPHILMTMPAVIVTFVFIYLPIFGLLIAFKDYSPKLGILGSPWAALSGFGNFAEIFKTPGLPEAIWNTFYINALTLLINFPAPLIFALFLNEIRQKMFKRVVQTVSYLPYFLSWIAVTSMVTTLLSQYGAINDFLKLIGLERTIFLDKGEFFLPTYILVTVWKGIGWNSIIYLSNISGISPELYEAARIDGAGRWKSVFHITLPALVPTAMILLIMSVGQIFGSNFELVYGLQNDISWNTEVISTVVYKFGLMQGKHSMTTALGLLQGVIALILTMGANQISQKVSSVSMW